MAQQANDRAPAASKAILEQADTCVKTIVDNVKDAIITLDADGVIETLNYTGERIFGYPEAEVVGKTLDLLLPLTEPRPLKRFLDRLTIRVEDTRTDLAPHETEGQRKDGRIFDAEVAVSRTDAGGREVYVVCLRDISKRKEAERALKESEARYRTLVENAAEALVVYDIDADAIVDCNENATELFGMQREEILTRTPPAFSPETQADGTPSFTIAKSYMEKALQGHTLTFEWTHRNALGQKFPSEVRLVRLPSADSRLIRASITDITERKRAEDALRASERRYRELFENVMDGVYHTSRSGWILSANPALIKMLGFDTEAELKYFRLRDLYANPADREELVRLLNRDGEVRNKESRMKRADGGEIVVLENAKVVRDESGEISGFEGTLTDISERILAETAVLEEKERAQITLQSIGDAVITTDAEGCIDYLNPVAEDLTGWESRAARGKPITEVFNIVHEVSRFPVDNPITRCLREGRVMNLADNTVLINQAGHEIAIQDSAAPIRDSSGNVIGAVMVFHDVSRERRLRRALSYQASHDALTGLINRREFENCLMDALASTDGKDDVYHALLYLDIDQFKLINDTCGHTAGDELLKQITSLVQGQIRTTDTLARLGGDEFGLLLENCGLSEAVRVADNLREAIKAFRFVWQDAGMNVSVSIGVVEVSEKTSSVAAVMSAADVACYDAKDQGRNRIHVYQIGDVPQRHKEMQWVSRITRALEENRFELFYQPIVPIGQHRDCRGHYELLLRMRDEEGVLVQPDTFIPAAERYNLMPNLDRWVIREALSALADYEHESGAEGSYILSINLSGTSLNDEHFLDFVVAQFDLFSPPPGAICFEITETAAIANITSVVHFMHALKELGCLFSLDDFGSGLSSFTYLKNLPVDYLKIDGHFIKNLTVDKIDQSMVDAISKMGHAMGIKTVAERVETHEVLDTLAAIGVEYAQGYHIAAPQSVVNFKRFSRELSGLNLRMA